MRRGGLALLAALALGCTSPPIVVRVEGTDTAAALQDLRRGLARQTRILARLERTVGALTAALAGHGGVAASSTAEPPADPSPDAGALRMLRRQIEEARGLLDELRRAVDAAPDPDTPPVQ